MNNFYPQSNCFYPQSDTQYSQSGGPSTEFYTKIRPRFVDESINNLDNFAEYNSISNPAAAKPNDIEYEYEKTFLQVFSADRDLSFFPNPADFSVRLPTSIKDIVKIEISSGNFPSMSPINNHAFIYLDIPTANINHIYTTSGQKYFAILALHPGNASGFLSSDKSASNHMKKVFKPPLSHLNELRLTLREPDGSVVVLGNETGDIDYSIQTSYVFQIETRTRKSDALYSDFRNV